MPRKREPKIVWLGDTPVTPIISRERKQWNEQTNRRQIETAPASELVKERLKES